MVERVVIDNWEELTDISLSIIWARDFWDQGLLLNLNPYVERTPELQPDQFIPATQLYNQVDGNIYGITNAMDVDLLIYNLDILEESGFSTDPNTYDTWEGFYDAVQKLTVYEPDGTVARYGLQMDIQASTTFSSWLTANGGSFYSPDLTSVGFNTPEGFETAEYLLRFHDAGLLGGIGAFISWKAAMQRGINADPYFFEQAAPDIRYTLSAFPKGPSGTQRGATAWGNMYSIAKGSANPDLAWEYIKFYTGLEGNIEMFRQLRYVSSPRRDFYQSEAWNQIRADHDWMPLIPQIAYLGGVYPFLKYSDFASRVWSPLMAPAFRREVSLVGAFEQAATVYNRILAGESVD